MTQSWYMKWIWTNHLWVPRAQKSDLMKEQVATFKRADMNGDYIIKNADKQSQDLQRNREVDEILLPEVGEQTNEVTAEDIAECRTSKRAIVGVLFRIGPRVIDDRTDYTKKTMIQTSQVYEVNLNKAMDE